MILRVVLAGRARKFELLQRGRGVREVIAAIRSFWAAMAPLTDWFLLAGSAGFINTGGFLACRRFVSHVTGFANMQGVALAERNWPGALSMASVPLYFLLGCMFSAWVVDRRIKQGRDPLYALPLSLIATLMCLVALGGEQGIFGPFGEYDVGLHHVLLAALCLACGIQNAVVTIATGSIMRSTHLTGTTTDLGTGLVRCLLMHRDSPERQLERRFNWMRFGQIAFFIMGACAGAFVFPEWQYLGFTIPGGIALLCAGLIRLRHR